MQFLRFKVTFYLEEDEDSDPAELKSLDFKYGETLPLEEYPVIDDKDGFYAMWDITNVENIHFDEDITAVYRRYITTLASEQLRLNMQSAILVDGYFHEDDKLECKEMGLSDIGFKNVKEHWLISFRDDKSDTHLVRYRKPDSMKNAAVIYINHAGRWEKVKPVQFGGYDTFDISGSFAEIAVCETAVNTKIYIIAGACAGAVILSVILIILIRNIKKKKRLKTKSKAEDNTEKTTEKTTGTAEDTESVEDI